MNFDEHIKHTTESKLVLNNIDKQDLALEERLPKDEIKKEIIDKINSFATDAEAQESFEAWTSFTWKTLKNFLNDHTKKPYPLTILSFLSWVLETKDEIEVFDKSSNTIKNYLVLSGYQVSAERKDLSHILSRSRYHVYIYDLTADNRVIKKDEVISLGPDALEALNDLLLEDVVMALSNEEFTTGRVRAHGNLDFYRVRTKATIENIPWVRFKKNLDLSDAGVSSGNICVPEESVEELIRDIISLSKKVDRLERKAKKLTQDKTSNVSYVIAAFDLNPKED